MKSESSYKQQYSLSKINTLCQGLIRKQVSPLVFFPRSWDGRLATHETHKAFGARSPALCAIMSCLTASTLFLYSGLLTSISTLKQRVQLLSVPRGMSYCQLPTKMHAKESCSRLWNRRCLIKEPRTSNGKSCPSPRLFTLKLPLPFKCFFSVKMNGFNCRNCV